MKSERRHELQTNYLADHLGTAVESGKPFAAYALAAIAAVIVAAVGYGVYSSYSASTASAAWGDYYFNIGSGDAEVFQQVAEDHSGTTAANWSKQAWADNQMLEGLDQIHSNRKSAEETIGKAIEAYQQVLDKTYEADLKNRAAMGLGQAYESIGKLDEAARYYKQVTSSSQDGFATMATRRLAWITSGEGKSFYEWFATPRAATPPPSFPTDLSKPPAAPDIKFPEAGPAGSMPPAAGTQPPTAVAPVETKPADALPPTTPPPVAPSETSPPAVEAAKPEVPATPAPTPAVPEAAPVAPAPTAEPPKS